MICESIGSTCVYVVEDSKLMLALLERVFHSELGVRVIGHSADADAAIHEILECRPDIVVVDLSLRQGSGFDVLRVVTKLSPAPACLVLTNHSSTPYKEAADRLGVGENRFFDKTDQIPSLIACVHDLAESRATAIGAEEDPTRGPEHEPADRRRSVQGAGRAGDIELRHRLPHRGAEQPGNARDPKRR